MPLLSPVLMAGFLPMFQAETAPTSVKTAALMWAQAYVDYCLPTAPAAAAKLESLANDLEQAFSPDAQAGPGLLIAALAKFWPGTACTGMAPTAQAVAFIPTGDTQLNLGISEPDAENQANTLAQKVHALTIASVKVVIPPATAQVPIV